jgi:hypothetical protein
MMLFEPFDRCKDDTLVKRIALIQMKRAFRQLASENAGRKPFRSDGNDLPITTAPYFGRLASSIL